MSDFDQEVIDNLIGSVGPETARELVDFFIEESRDRLVTMTALFAALDDGNNTEELRRNAHSLKGAAASYGLAGLSAMAKALEFACADGDAAIIKRALDEVSGSADGHLTILQEAVSSLQDNT